MLVTDNQTLSFKASLGELVETLQTHAVEREPAMPPPAMVALYPTQKAVGVAPVGPGLAAELADIVTWCRTLEEPTGWWCRRADGTLLVLIDGRASDGTKVIVSGGGPYRDSRGLVSLPVGKSRPVTIDALDTLSTQLRAADASRPTITEQERFDWAELARLTDALDSHLTALPILVTTPLMLSFDLRTRSIKVGAGGPNLVLALSILLPWTYSLGDGSIGWGRTTAEHDDLLLVTVHSCLTGGIPIKMTAQVPYQDCADLVDLAVGETESVSLATLDAVWDQIDPSNDQNRYTRRTARRRQRKAGSKPGRT